MEGGGGGDKVPDTVVRLCERPGIMDGGGAGDPVTVKYRTVYNSAKGVRNCWGDDIGHRGCL